MKRFINIGDQIYPNTPHTKQFSFYCTVDDCYEKFCDEDVWDNSVAFKEDYIRSGGGELDTYLRLIPDEFKNELRAQEKSTLNFYDWIKEVATLDKPQQFLIEREEIFTWHKWYKNGMTPTEAINCNYSEYG